MPKLLPTTIAKKLPEAIAVIVCASLLYLPSSVSAITVSINYDYDANGPKFFGVGNPGGAAAGAQAKAALEAAASFYSTILTDAFSAIQVPAEFHSSSGGMATFFWKPSFSNPISGASELVTIGGLAADEYRIYAGARSLSAGTLGVGGYSSGGAGYSISGLGPGEFSAQKQKGDAFVSAVDTRGQSSGFSAWGGSITFDNDGSTAWHFNHTTAPAPNTNDFYSVAIHELGHALGLGTSPEWIAYAGGPNFTGPSATSLMGMNPPLSEPDPSNGKRGHWKEGTMSQILGTTTAQEAAMDPNLTTGTRKRLTKLDAAALTDIGWSVTAPPPPTYNPADFNEDTFVNAADLTMWKGAFGLNANGDADGDNDSDGRDFLIWQRNFGATSSLPAGSGAFAAVPEPSGALAAIMSAATLVAKRRRR
jgi:hypothetical protein